jgi:hypothetical protein
MTLKAPLFDAIFGQKMELGLCVERIKVKEILLLGPFTFVAHSSLLLASHCKLQEGSLL